MLIDVLKGVHGSGVEQIILSGGPVLEVFISIQKCFILLIQFWIIIGIWKCSYCS